MSKTKSSKKQVKAKRNKYDWNQLEIDFYKSGCKSVSEFFRANNIPNNSRNRTHAKEWKKQKCQNSDKIVAKTTEKFIEKQSKKNADILVKSTDVAQKILNKIMQQISVDGFVNSKSLTEYANATSRCDTIIKNNDNGTVSVTKNSQVRSGMVALGIEEVSEDD